MEAILAGAEYDHLNTKTNQLNMNMAYNYTIYPCLKMTCLPTFLIFLF